MRSGPALNEWWEGCDHQANHKGDILADVTLARSQNKSVSKYTYHTITLRWHRTLAAYGHWVSMTTRWMHRRKCKCTELEASIQAMKWEIRNMAAVWWKWTTQGPQVGRRETGKAVFRNRLVPHAYWSPCSQLMSILGRAAITQPVSVFCWVGASDIADPQNY